MPICVNMNGGIYLITPRCVAPWGHHVSGSIMHTMSSDSFYIPPSAHTFTLTRRVTRLIDEIRIRLIDRIATARIVTVATEVRLMDVETKPKTAVAAVTIPGAQTAGIVEIDFTS